MQNQLSGQINNQITGPIGNIQTSMPQQMNQIGPGQLGPGQMQQQLNHIQRKVSNITFFIILIDKDFCFYSLLLILT